MKHDINVSQLFDLNKGYCELCSLIDVNESNINVFETFHEYLEARTNVEVPQCTRDTEGVVATVLSICYGYDVANGVLVEADKNDDYAPYIMNEDGVVYLYDEDGCMCKLLFYEMRVEEFARFLILSASDQIWKDEKLNNELLAIWNRSNRDRINITQTEVEDD